MQLINIGAIIGLIINNIILIPILIYGLFFLYYYYFCHDIIKYRHAILTFMFNVSCILTLLFTVNYLYFCRIMMLSPLLTIWSSYLLYSINWGLTFSLYSLR